MTGVRRVRRVGLAAVIASAAIVGVGCSVDVGSATTEERIADELESGAAPELGLGEVEVTCPDDQLVAGIGRVECVSTGGPGRLIWVVDADADGFEAWTVNLITPEGVDLVRQVVADEATRLGQTAVAPAAVECGEGPFALDDELDLLCSVDTGDGSTAEAVVVFTDIRATGDNLTSIRSVSIDLAER